MKCITNFDNHLADSIGSTLEFVSSAVDKAHEEMKQNIWRFECEVKNVLNSQDIEDINLIGLIDMNMRLLATSHLFIEDLFASNSDVVRKYFWLLNDIKQLYNVMSGIANNIHIHNKVGKKVSKTLPKLTECERVINAYKTFVSPFYDHNFIEKIMIYALDKIEDLPKDIA